MTVAYVPWLIDLAVSALAVRCQAEAEQFHTGQTHDDRYAIEIFRRAIVERDEPAFEAAYQIYHGQVSAWCRRSGADEEDLEEFVNATWGKFWIHFTEAKLQAAGSLAGILTYLKLCARSVTLDAERRSIPMTGLDAAEQVATPEPAPDEHCINAEQRETLWRIVERHLNTEQERTLVRLTYQLGLRPADIHTARPDLFPEVTGVYRMLRNVLDRLRRDAGLRSLRRPS